MKPSLRKLYNIFKIEIEHGYDNRAVIGGLDRFCAHWEAEARLEDLPEEVVQVVVQRLNDYPRLAPALRAEILVGLWKLIQQSEKLDEPLPTTYFTSNMDEPLQKNSEEQLNNLPNQTEKAQLVETQSADEVELRIEPQTTNPRQDRKQPQQDLEPAALKAPLTVLPGVGTNNARSLAQLGLHTLRDLLYYFPRRYDDYSKMKPINRLQFGEEITIIGMVQSVHLRKAHARSNEIKLVDAIISDGTGAIRITWFNQPWNAQRLHEGAQVVLSGKVDQHLGRPTMTNPEWEPVEQQQLSTNRIVPVYSLTGRITQRWVRRTMFQVVNNLAPRLFDPLPDETRRSAELMDLATALIQVHFPDSWDDLKLARQRIAFDEIFLLQMGVLRQKRAWQSRTARAFTTDPQWLAVQIARLPFALTGAQKRAVQDLQHDLVSGQPMNRLLQGDVGSGKTAIAALAIAIVTNHRSQAALMAPTSILAEQHYKNLLNMLAGVGDTQSIPASQSDLNGETLPLPPLYSHQIELLIGATPEAEKRRIRDGLAEGNIRLVIGTHALIEDPIRFADLQLIIVDEQHRFGVEQRSALRSKGENPHLLVMTATPIPRSLALTVYGDLDLTIIDELPPGRQPVSTYVVLPRDRERAYSLIRTQVSQGRQAFIIYPLVEESEKIDAKAAVEESNRLQSEYFPNLKLGLLHGRMRPDEKEHVMSCFRNGEFDILVSTSVVEVGVDVPNATVMVIEGANRFGLAQLHQFRGRVGRGADKSFCILIPDTNDVAENERLKVMTETNDGFILAEKDLEQRGPGQFLGTRQSGYSELQLANMSDIHLIEKARRYAQDMFQQDPDLASPQNQFLRAALQRAWGDITPSGTGGGDIS